MSPSDATLLRYILAETDFLLRQIRGVSREMLEEDDMLRRATVYSLVVIGEASNNVSLDLQQQQPAIAWRKIIGTRHRIVHEYFGIDYDIVWQIVNVQIPNLHDQLSALLNR